MKKRAGRDSFVAQTGLRLTLAMIAGCLILTGCASPDVNPASARPGRGYVDFYTQPKSDVWWKVDVFDSRNQDYKEFTAQFEAPAQGVFRVEARPGRHKARIWFVNRAIEAPAEIEAEVREGMVTPIAVKMEKGGHTYVRSVEDQFDARPRNKITDYQQQLWRISASVLPPVPYTPKELAPYWK